MNVAGGRIDPGGLDGCNFLLAKSLADDVEPAGE
jgi:hypothetical protein